MVDSDLSSKIEIYISCRNLPKLDRLSKSDPFVLLSLKDEVNGKWTALGQTETIMNDHNPEFKQQFKIDYMFEENQYLRADIYDRDNKSADLKAQDYVGFAQFLVGEMVAAAGQKLNQNVQNKKGKQVFKDKHACTCCLTCEEVSGTNDLVLLELRGSRFEKMDMFGGADPYMQIHRSREDGSWVLVHQTETIKKSRDPAWKRFTLSAQLLCNGDYDRPLWWRVYDWDKNSDDDLIGEAQHSLRDILEQGFVMDLKRLKNTGRKKNKVYGRVKTIRGKIIKQPSFLDYIKGGCQVSLMVAIDFTASNGSPNSPDSLHYINPRQPNEYTRAISSVGSVVAPYDSDQKFPVWGFGAKIGSEVSHCFSLTFDEFNPEVVGVQGILDVYQRSFGRLRLSGPTLFQQIIQTADAVASTPFSKNTQNYYILLILTDGIINDMKKTINAIVTASEKPLSIIIVGVGQANFGQMEALDADGQLLRNSKNVPAARDIVQFVPYRDYNGQHVSMLAKETLLEVPKQFLSFMKKHNIEPMDPSVRIAAYEAQQAKLAAEQAAQYAAMQPSPAMVGVAQMGMPGMPGMPGVPGIPGDPNTQMQIQMQQGMGAMNMDPNAQYPVAQPLGPGQIPPSAPPGSGSIPPAYSP